MFKIFCYVGNATFLVKPPSLSSHLPCQATFLVKPPSLSSHLPCQATFLVKPPSLSSYLPCQATFLVKPPSLSSHLPCQATFLVKPPSLSSHLPCQLFFSVSRFLSSPTTFQPTPRFHLLVYNFLGLQTRVDNPSLLDHCIFSQSLHENHHDGQCMQQCILM